MLPSDEAPLLTVRGLSVTYPLGGGVFGPRRILKALTSVDFSIQHHRSLGVVGETGSGKSTLGRALVGLTARTGGHVVMDGREVYGLQGRDLGMQLIFQDALSSLDPRMNVFNIMREGLAGPAAKQKRSDTEASIVAALDAVGLSRTILYRYPNELSGGQAQRIAIARALLGGPRLLICDEPVSALDVSTQAQVINLLGRLVRERGLSLLFISHDLAIVRRLCTRVLVLYLGRIMEIADRAAIFGRPRHPYTRALLASVPSSGGPNAGQGRHVPLRGDLPSPLDAPSGCVFRTRCYKAQERCSAEAPRPLTFGGGNVVYCHYPEGETP